MIYGIGTDLVAIERIERALQRYGERFANRLLSTDELHHFRSHKHATRYLAKRFAAKEAISKALGTGLLRGVNFSDVAVLNNSVGKPEVHCSKQAQGIMHMLGVQQIHISLSDDGVYAQAFAIAET